MGGFEKMYDVVLKILEGDVRARNDDKWLVIKALQYLNQQIEIDEERVIWYIPLAALHEVPSFENIRRRRAEIQNRDGLFLPTDPLVLRDRKIKEEKIREYYASKPDVVQAWEELVYAIQ